MARMGRDQPDLRSARAIRGLLGKFTRGLFGRRLKRELGAKLRPRPSDVVGTFGRRSGEENVEIDEIRQEVWRRIREGDPRPLLLGAAHYRPRIVVVVIENGTWQCPTRD